MVTFCNVQFCFYPLQNVISSYFLYLFSILKTQLLLVGSIWHSNKNQFHIEKFKSLWSSESLKTILRQYHQSLTISSWKMVILLLVSKWHVAVSNPGPLTRTCENIQKDSVPKTNLNKSGVYSSYAFLCPTLNLHGISSLFES